MGRTTSRVDRVALACLLLSVLLHLLLALIPSSTARSVAVRVYRLPRPLARFERRPRLAAAGPAAAPVLSERLDAPQFVDHYGGVDAGVPWTEGAPFVAVPDHRQLPEADVRRAIPEPPDSARTIVDLNELALASVRDEAGRRQEYLHLGLPDVDTTDAASRARQRARQIVERAVDSMGGLQALQSVVSVRAMVWIQSSWTQVGPVVRGVVPYVYPVERWRLASDRPADREAIAMRLSLDPSMPSPAYALQSPPELSAYRALFGPRWLRLLGNGRAGRLRQEGEMARWHFLDGFLGQGVRLEYLGSETFNREPAEVVGVFDLRYGNYKEAFFSQETGLLIGTREGLTPEEASRYWRANAADPPVWTTVCARYEQVGPVLVPHVLQRWKDHHLALTVHLSLAWNGAAPDETEPAVWTGTEPEAPLPHVRPR